MAISAFERTILNSGWISCPTITTNATYTLDDLISTNSGNCYTIDIPASAADNERTVFLSTRQRIDPIDQLQTSCVPSDHGSMTTGLLATVAEENNSNELFRFGVIAADNDLHLSISASDYEGDMFSGSVSTQITPWTRPNISGYALQYPTAGFSMQSGNWQAVDNIRQVGNDMVFDYKSDFRQSPTIREDSWMAAESADISITGTALVTNNATLFIHENVSFAHLTIDAGAEVLVEDGWTVTVTGTLTVQSGGRLHVRPGGAVLNNGVVYEGLAVFPTQDAYLRDGDVNDNTGTENLLQAMASNTAAPDRHFRALMQWDLSGIMPSSTVTSAKLRIDVTDETSSPGYIAYRLKTAWTEHGATWNSPWAVPGVASTADRDTKVLTTLIPDALGAYETPFTADGLSAVQAWIDSPSMNYRRSRRQWLHCDDDGWGAAKQRPPAMAVTRNEWNKCRSKA
jgi:hypothetical protein